MTKEVPLIRRIPRGIGYEYSICPEGVFLLKALKSKKLRIIFNITHASRPLTNFNSWFFNQEGNHDNNQVCPTACLTISQNIKEISEDRVIVILTAYEQNEPEPLMVLLGYLGASVFMYHHFEGSPSSDSPLTTTLSKLWSLLSQTDVNELNSELSHSKGYARNPYFLCLLSETDDEDKFQKVYRCSEQTEAEVDLNRAIDTLIDYFPMRRAHKMALKRQSVSAIGMQFQSSILGRTVFNFQFTGGTLENLCFDCCQAFNAGRKINLNECYMKIVQNQKARLEGQSMEHMMSELQTDFFFGLKIDLQSENCFPLSSYDLLRRHTSISDKVLQTSLHSATCCMTLSQYCALEKRLRQSFQEKLKDFEQANARKADNLCNECYGILDSIPEYDYNQQNLQPLFREVQNKLELFTSECSVLTKGDQVQSLLWQYYNRLFQQHFSHLQKFVKEVVRDLIIKDQEQKVEIQDLKYRVKLRENDLRALQLQYEIQGEVLNQTKYKLLCENDSPPPQAYTSETGKLKKKLQELQEEVKDKALHIEELEGILQRIEGACKEKDKNKLKFSKEIQELMKDVSQKVNNYYQVVREAKDTSQLEEDLRKRFAKERAAIQEEKNNTKSEIARRDAEIERLRIQKLHLQKTLEESRAAIQALKSSLSLAKESINNLQRNCAQLNCVLAETDHQLQYYRKGLLLVGEQQTKGAKNEKLNKFCNSCSIKQLKELLLPFVRK